MSQVRDVGDTMNVGYEARDPDTRELVTATVALTVTDPDGADTTPSVTSSATGLYEASFDLTDEGPWFWRWNVTTPFKDVEYGGVWAADPAPSTYAPLPQLRKRVTGSDDGSRDDELMEALTAAARGFDRETGRRPGGFELARTATSRVFPVDGRVVRDRDGRYRLLVDEFGTESGLVVEIGGDSTWTVVTDYRTWPRNALADREPITALSRLGGWGSDEVRITTRWGRPVLEDDVVQGVLIAGHRIYLRRHTPEGVRGSQDTGIVRISRVDPDVERIIQRFALPGFA